MRVGRLWFDLISFMRKTTDTLSNQNAAIGRMTVFLLRQSSFFCCCVFALLCFSIFGMWVLLDTIKIYSYFYSLSVPIWVRVISHSIYHLFTTYYEEKKIEFIITQDNRWTLNKYGRNKTDYLTNDKIWNEVMDFIFRFRYIFSFFLSSSPHFIFVFAHFGRSFIRFSSNI